MIAGTPALIAPISCAGTVLSQPPSRTTASSGYERMHSSTSIAMRLRKSIALGFMRFSPSEMVGNSSGRPPGLQDAALGRVGEPAEVQVAVDELGPRVADADHGAAVERGPRDALGLDRGSVDEAREVVGAEPARAPQGLVVHRGRSVALARSGRDDGMIAA